MPFTVSHAIVAVPFRRTAIPVAAVAVGSMAPDAVLFAPFLPPYAFAHAPIGIVTIDLAVSLVVLAVWWWLVRPAWTRALPVWLLVRVPSGWTVPERVALRRTPLVVAGAVLGSVTHVVWDAFSHVDGWVVQRVPALSASYAGHPGYSVVQDVSSVGGLLALAACCLVWFRTPRDHAFVARGAGRAGRVVLAASAAVVVLVVLGRATGAVLAGGGPSAVLVVAAFTVPAAVAVVLVLGAVAILLSERCRARRASPTDRRV